MLSEENQKNLLKNLIHYITSEKIMDEFTVLSERHVSACIFLAAKPYIPSLKHVIKTKSHSYATWEIAALTMNNSVMGLYEEESWEDIENNLDTLITHLDKQIGQAIKTIPMDELKTSINEEGLAYFLQYIPQHSEELDKLSSISHTFVAGWIENFDLEHNTAEAKQIKKGPRL